MVSKDVLAQYYYLSKEKEQIKKRIETLEKQIRRLEEDGVVKDSVTGGMGGTQHFVIEGYQTTEHHRKVMFLRERKNTLKQLEEKTDEMISDIEEFVYNIPDSRIRLIVSLKFVDGLTWNQVADCIGGGNTEDTVKKMFYRYMDKNKENV